MPTDSNTADIDINTSYTTSKYIHVQLISLNWNLVNRNFRKCVGCEALAPIQDNGSLSEEVGNG